MAGAILGPVLGAATGSSLLGSILGPVLGAVASGIMGGGGGGGDAAPPPPPPAPASTEPEGALDQEAIRLRALKRRRNQNSADSLLNLTDTAVTSNKTLLGE